MKLFFKTSMLFSLLLIPVTFTHTKEPHRNIENLGEEDDLFSQLFNENLNEFSAVDALQTQAIDPEECLEALNTFQIPELLENSFFIRTNPINIRNIVDSPILGRTRLHDERAVLQLELFYEHAEKAYFTRKSTFIDSIISLDFSNINQTLENISTLLDIDLNTIFRVIGIVNNAKIQERQTGFMMSAGGNHGNWHLSWRTPLYWVEHNFYLTDAEQRAITNLTNPTIPPSEKEIAQTEAFFTKILVADRLGVGDTRLKLEHLIHETDHLHAFFGISLTVPTAFTISRGLIGGKFQKSLCRPEIDLCKLLEEFNDDMQKAINQISCFAQAAVEQLTANVADRGLGNNGHFGFAPTIDLYNFVSENMGIELYAALEYLAAKNERRYFIEKKNLPKIKNIIENSDNFNEEQAISAIEFLNTEFVNTFFPFVFRTRVRPGVIIKIRPAIHIFRDGFTGWVGYDFWWQSEESLLEIEGPAPIVDQLKIEQARKSRAEQQRLFFDARWHILSTENSDWDFAIKADWTVHNVGIGREFTTAVGFQGTF